VGEELAQPPFATLATSSRAAIQSGLDQDPLARGIVVSLLTAAIAAVALALVGLALVTSGFVRDDGDTLFDLETQGVGPRALRATVRWRALGVAALGLASGIVLGGLMVAVTERLLALDATLTLPDPPLRRVIPWLTIGASALLFALATAALIELVLRVAHRRSSAGRGLTGEGWAA
jgi:predicted lysophospholipase L1 biosynthesis ABC-type transport system permease subunit